MNRFIRLFTVSVIVLIIGSFPAFAKSLLIVRFLDVGDGDSILIQAPSGHTMLIDAGQKKDADLIEATLNKLGIRKLDVVVGTHPHKDHVGSLDKIILDYPVGRVYLPTIGSDAKQYKQLTAAIRKKGLKTTFTKASMGIELDPDVAMIILAPLQDGYEDPNDYSVVIKLAYGNRSFLFAGDATKISEREMLSRSFSYLHSDILKVGLHGRRNATSRKFLRAVSPQWAVISTGQDEPPDKSTLERLDSAGCKIYRTDIHGTIVMKTDGNKLDITTEK